MHGTVRLDGWSQALQRVPYILGFESIPIDRGKGKGGRLLARPDFSRRIALTDKGMACVHVYTV